MPKKSSIEKDPLHRPDMDIAFALPGAFPVTRWACQHRSFSRRKRLAAPLCKLPRKARSSATMCSGDKAGSGTNWSRDLVFATGELWRAAGVAERAGIAAASLTAATVGGTLLSFASLLALPLVLLPPAAVVFAALSTLVLALVALAHTALVLMLGTLSVGTPVLYVVSLAELGAVWAVVLTLVGKVFGVFEEGHVPALAKKSWGALAVVVLELCGVAIVAILASEQTVGMFSSLVVTVPALVVLATVVIRDAFAVLSRVFEHGRLAFSGVSKMFVLLKDGNKR